MKKILFFAFTMLLGTLAFMQAQNGFNYKFLIAGNGNPLPNTAVTVKFQIYQGATLEWEEEHNVTTDANGIASVIMGEGTQTGGSLSAFDDIDWSLPHTYNAFFDTGSGYVQLVNGEAFKYVPSAKYATKAGQVDYANVTNAPVTFYKLGTVNDLPTDINDDIYHMGMLAVGTSTVSVPTAFYVANGNSGDQYASFQYIIANDAGDKTVEYNQVTGSGGGIIRGVTNYISAGGTSAHVGVRNHLTDSDSGTRVGVHNLMAGSGDGFITGVYSEITNTGNGYQYGMYNLLTGTGNGLHAAIVNSVQGSGTGLKYGTYNALYNSGSGNQYGTYNEMSNTGSAVQYGTFTTYMYSTSTGDKYGEYIEIGPTLDGQHYGVYADVQKSGSYAGYFKGDVYVSRKLKGRFSGEADMKAYLYGEVDAAGNIIANASSDGFTVSKTAPGVYEIHFGQPFINSDEYMVVATAIQSATPVVVTVEKQNELFIVRTWDLSSNLTDNDFSFTVYKK